MPSLAHANQVNLGSKENCYERTIYQFIHEKGNKSCQHLNRPQVPVERRLLEPRPQPHVPRRLDPFTPVLEVTQLAALQSFMLTPYKLWTDQSFDAFFESCKANCTSIPGSLANSRMKSCVPLNLESMQDHDVLHCIGSLTASNTNELDSNVGNQL
jgi:hypothetical protein